MKSIKITLLLLTISFQLIKAQNFDGTYICDNQNIKINGSQIEYELISFGDGLNTIFKGTGIIDIKKKDYSLSQTISSLHK